MLKKFLMIFFVSLLTINSTNAWIGLVAESWDLLNVSKWNEMITKLNTKLEQSNITWTWNVVVTNSWTGVVISLSWWVSWINTENITVTDWTCATTTIDHNKFINAYAEIVTLTLGTEIAPVWTIDPDVTSTWDANLINNNYTDLIYNNSNTWTANKSLPAVDLWASVAAWLVRIYWWSPSSYGVTNWVIQWSTDWTTWVNLFTGISKTSWVTWDYNDYVVSGSYRYYRLYSISSVNATYFVISELEVFSVWTSTSEFFNVFNRNIEIKNNWWKVEICNNDGSNLNIEVNWLQ